MYKLSYKKRVWIVKQKLRGVTTSQICLAQSISRMTLSNLFNTYKQYGWDGLKDHKTGRPETVLNPNAVTVILDLRKQYGYGAVIWSKSSKKEDLLFRTGK